MKEKAMLEAFDAFTHRITLRYAEARACLVKGDYVQAQQIMARLSTSHARTSLSLRNVLIKDGLLPEDEK
jgi:hypothetical protein